MNPATAAAAPQEPPRHIIHVPLFADLIGRLGDGRQVIMDLGPAQGATVELLSEFRCRLDIIDLAPSLGQLNGHSPEDRPELEAQVRRILPAAGGEKLSAVLCWDLLNYLDRLALDVLVSELARRSGSTTLMHALISYSSATQPECPGIHYPAGPEQIAAIPLTSTQAPSPRYTPKGLEKIMHGFVAERTMLLNNGMQEYLFHRQD